MAGKSIVLTKIFVALHLKLVYRLDKNRIYRLCAGIYRSSWILRIVAGDGVVDNSTDQHNCVRPLEYCQD